MHKFLFTNQHVVEKSWVYFLIKMFWYTKRESNPDYTNGCFIWVNWSEFEVETAKAVLKSGSL